MAGDPYPTAGDAVSELFIRRKSRRQAVTIGTTSSTSSTIRFDDGRSGALHLANASTAVASLTVWAADLADGPYGPLVDADGAVVAVGIGTAAVACYALPDVVGLAHFVRLVADQDIGTAATASINVKS